MAESRPIWLQEALAPREEDRCAEGPGGAWSACLDACHRVLAWVGPWQYQCMVHGGYYPPLVPTLPHPGYSPCRRTAGTGHEHGVAGRWDMLI